MLVQYLNLFFILFARGQRGINNIMNYTDVLLRAKKRNEGKGEATRKARIQIVQTELWYMEKRRRK